MKTTDFKYICVQSPAASRLVAVLAVAFSAHPLALALGVHVLRVRIGVQALRVRRDIAMEAAEQLPALPTVLALAVVWYSSSISHFL